MAADPRRLKGNKAAATCCVASCSRPGLIATAAEDGCICWFDMRCKDMLFSMNVGNNTPISSLCFKPGNEDIIYVSAENGVKCFDLHMTGSWKLLASYNFNVDEINQIACHPKSSFLSAADDTGDVKIIDIHQKCLYKTLRGGHKTICSSVQFLPWRSREVITGGLDSKLVLWDFSKGRPIKTIDFGTGSDGGQSYNPAFIHAIVVSDLDMVDTFGKICAIARGDGVVSVVNIESELASLKSRYSGKSKWVSTKSTTQTAVLSSKSQSEDQTDKMLHMDYKMGGHAAAVSSVTFSLFGEKGKFVVSGGNDKAVKVWDWSKSFGPGLTSNINDLLSLNISLSRKVNWLCTTPSDTDNLVVCDTSKVVKVYSIV